jgi:MFS family permease
VTAGTFQSPGRGSGLFAIMALMGTYFVLVQINRSAGGVLANTLSTTRGLDPTEIATVTGVMFLAAAAFQIPYGLVYDRYGPRLVVIVSGVIGAAGIAVFACAETTGGLTIGRILIGAGHGGVITAIILLAINWAPPDRVAQVTAIVIAASGSLGGILATAPLAIALEATGLCISFGALAGVSLLVTGLIAVMVRDHPPGATNSLGRHESLIESLRGLWSVVTNRRMWPIFAMATCFSAPFSTIGGLWAGPYLHHVHGLNEADTGLGLGALMLAFYVGTALYGPLDRLFNTRKWVVLGGVVIMIVSLLVLAIVPGLGLWSALGLLVVFSAAAPFFFTLSAHCRGFVEDSRAGRAITFVSMMGIATIFALQWFTGLIVETLQGVDGEGPEFGYRMAFASVAAFLGLAGAVYLTAQDVKPNPAT